MRASIIFGHNGSGKSTIAREIAAISRGESGGYLYDESKKMLSLADNECAGIRVFDEDYVESKTRIKGDGLDSIVMLGKQVSAAEAIEETEKSIRDVTAEIEELDSKIAELENGSNSVDKLEKKAKESVKSAGWAERCQKITGKKSSLSKNSWIDVQNAKTEETRETLGKRFEAKLSIFEKARATGQDMINHVPSIDIAPYDEGYLTELLSRQIDNPELSEREQRILELVKNDNQIIVDTAVSVFSSEDTHICPMCQQEVSREHKESIVASIHKVLNKAVEEFRVELSKASLPRLVETVDIPDQVTESVKADLKDALRETNRLVNEYNSRIELRKANIYTAQTADVLGLDAALKKLEIAVESVNSEIDSINGAIKYRSTLEKDLLKLNDEISRTDARQDIESWQTAEGGLTNARDAKNNKLGEQRRLLSKKQQQEATLKQIDIAVDVINSYLANVYFDSDRFKLVLDGEQYKVLSHGQSVAPDNISTGERNVLALCYFFTESGEGKEQGHADDDPQYVVLDDPISSFDMENRVGVCSLIRERAECILQSNDESKITVLTHDSSVMHDLQKVFEDIRLLTMSKSFAYNTRKIVGTVTEAVSKGTEYAALLNRVYRYASSETEDSDESYVIGNILRRIVEGYGTFNYGIGVEELFRDQDLAGRLGVHLPYIKSAMYRLMLNDESHLRDRVSTMNPSDRFGRFSYKDKRSCAQCVLLMLYTLDQTHVKRQLNGISIAELQKQVAAWEARFSSQSA
uniref:AAA family ATPase n=1 Tax=Olsenella uli TaxID=133926 RepID=UPI0028EC1591|nr:AAA family ATPase [Olsenella uli]